MQIGTKLRSATGPLGHKRLMHWCPACECAHGYYIVNPDGNPIWSFDGNYDRPTFKPSMRVYVTETTDDDDKPLPASIERTICHYFITRGRIEYCGDNPHKLNGQAVDLPDWPYAPGTYYGIDE